MKMLREVVKREWKLLGVAVLCLAAIAVISVQRHDYVKLRADYVKLQTNHGNLQTDYGNLQVTYENLQTDYGKLQTDYEGLLQEENGLEATLATTQAELSQVKKVYPLRYFYSLDELKEWVGSHCPVSYTEGTLIDASLALQRAALSDGYIWSVFIEPNTAIPMHYDVMSCVVVDDGICYVQLNGNIQYFERSFLER